jgi:hypothetical protein
VATRRPALSEAELSLLLAPLLDALDQGREPDPAALRTGVRELAVLLAARHPGRTVEVRIPPYTAVQCLEGPRHTRGTPPNVVEADPAAFVLLCSGRAQWSDLARTGRIRASGERSDLSTLMPLVED